MIEIREIQEKVREFDEKRAQIKKFRQTLWLKFIHLAEEIGEMAGQLYNSRARKEKFGKKNLKEEASDIILMGISIANSLHMDLETESSRKLSILNQRIDRDKK